MAIDANALDHKGGERDALVDRFNAAVKSKTVTVIVAAGVRDEVQHPRTPSDAKDAVLPQIYNLQPRLNTAQLEQRRQVAIILQGDAKPGKHAADASHISEAAETGCAYFITEDKRSSSAAKAAIGPSARSFSARSASSLCSAYSAC